MRIIDNLIESDTIKYKFTTSAMECGGLLHPIKITSQVIKDENGNPIKKGVLAEELLERSDARLILTGDYHHTFVKHFGDRTVMACGCLNIQARDMADYTPCCYILDTPDFSLEKIELKTFGEIDMNAPILGEAEDYAETIQLASLPKIDFRAAIEQVVEETVSDGGYCEVHERVSD